MHRCRCLLVLWLVAAIVPLAACSGPEEPHAQRAAVTRSQVEPGRLPPGSHRLDGRTLIVSLPYRARDNMLWTDGTPDGGEGPFVFQGLDLQPGAGPGGSDLAVFEYKARQAGTATLRFGLVPAGKTLTGPADTRVDPGQYPSYTFTVTVP